MGIEVGGIDLKIGPHSLTIRPDNPTPNLTRAKGGVAALRVWREDARGEPDHQRTAIGHRRDIDIALIATGGGIQDEIIAIKVTIGSDDPCADVSRCAIGVIGTAVDNENASVAQFAGLRCILPPD